MLKRSLMSLLSASLVLTLSPGLVSAGGGAEVIVPPDDIGCGVNMGGGVTLRDGSTWTAILDGGHRQEVNTRDGRREGKCIFRPATYVSGSAPPEVVRVTYIDGAGLIVHIVITPSGRAHYTYQGIPTS